MAVTKKAAPAAKKAPVKLGSKLSDPDSFTPEELARALKNADVLELWIKTVRIRAYEVMKEGGRVPGFKLGYGVRRRQWEEGTEEQMVKAVLKAASKADAPISKEDLFHPEEILSPAQMQKLLQEHGLWPRKRRNDTAEEPAKSVIDAFITLSSPELKILPDDDGDGPAVKSQEAAKEFV